MAPLAGVQPGGGQAPGERCRWSVHQHSVSNVTWAPSCDGGVVTWRVGLAGEAVATARRQSSCCEGEGGQGAGFRGYVRMSSLVWKVGVGKGRVALTTCPTLEQAITGTGG